MRKSLALLICIKIDTIKPSKGNDFDCGITSNDTKKKMIVPRFTIDMSECMYCDLCVHPCPRGVHIYGWRAKSR